MSLTRHIGFGVFHLGDFEPGEVLARADGSLARVCEDQPYRASRPDHIWVWVEWRTSNAQQMLLHRTARVHATSTEQAQLIERRRARRKRT